MFFYARNDERLSHCSVDPGFDMNWRDVSLIQLFTLIVQSNERSVVCINASQYTLLAGLASRLTSKRFVIWWAGTNESERNVGLLKKMYRYFVFKLANQFFCYSELARAYLVDQFSISPEKITILGNVTMDPLRLAEDERACFSSQGTGVVRLLSVGNLTLRKNHRFLLDVLNELRRGTSVEVQLNIVGIGPELSALESYANELGLKNVTFLGELKGEALLNIYRTSDVFVHAALMDQWPQVVNEAMSFGLPVVASDQSGLSCELLEPGRELFITPLQIVDFSNIILKLIADETLRKAIGATGRGAVSRLYQRCLVEFDKHL